MPAASLRHGALLGMALALPLTLLLAGCGGATRPTTPTVPAPHAPPTTPTAIVHTGTAVGATAVAPTPSATSLQARLEAALSAQSDVPAGFVASNVPPRADFLAGTDATAVEVFAHGASSGPGAEQLVVALFGFRDALSAAAGLGQAQSAVQALTTLPGGSLTVAQIPNSEAIGDATQNYRIAGALAGVGEIGFAVYWRHGSVVAGVTEFGADNSLLPPAVDALAQTQNARLTAAGF